MDWHQVLDENVEWFKRFAALETIPRLYGDEEETLDLYSIRVMIPIQVYPFDTSKKSITANSKLEF